MYLRKLASSSSKYLSSACKPAFGFLGSQRAHLQDGKLQGWSPPPTSSPLCSTSIFSTFTGVRDERAVKDPISDGTEALEFEDHLILKYKGVKLPLNYVWLRDHCRTGESINHVTQERMVDSVLIDPNIQPVNVIVKEETLKITWPDGHQSEYGLDWLLHNTYEGQKHVCGTMEPFLWDAATLSASPPPRVQYQDYLRDDRQLAKVLHTLLKHGFAFIEDAPATMEATLAAAERISHVRETFFGRHWFVTSDFERHDTGYTTAALPVHTDNTHFNEPPGLLVSHMLEEGDSGGTSVLVDGFHAAKRLRQDDPEGFDVLSSVPVPHHYLEPKLHMRTAGPIVELEPGSRKEIKMIRYSMYDRGILDTIPMGDLGRWYAALRRFTNYLRDPSNEYWFQLKPGQILMIYNWRVLHGRSAYTGNQRKLGGFYMPMDDFLSKARILKVI